MKSAMVFVTSQPLTKVCKRCGEAKPIEAFHLDGRNPNGTQRHKPYCPPCVKARRDERNAAVVADVVRGPDWPTCGCGCGEPCKPAPYTERRKGWVQGQPMERLKGHGGDCFNPDTYIDPKTGCHLFVHHPRPWTYRWFRYEGVVVQAHRFIWKWIHGELPENMDVHHKCANKGCVNPDHLEVLRDAEHTKLHQPDLVAARLRKAAA